MNQITALSEREQYLLRTLRLTHDPFAYVVAESELLADDNDPHFFSYFVDPIYKSDKSLLEAIKEPVHAVVYGKTGSGKTTLRYALEAACRAVPDKTLVVSIDIGKNSTSASDIEQVTKTTLLEAFATDLFVQLFEQYHLLQDGLTPELVHTLSQFWQAIIPSFRRQIKRWLKQGEPAVGLVGISKWWVIWHRAIVGYTPLTKERNAFLQQVLKDAAAAHKNTHDLEEGVKLAQVSGYKQIFILVDVAGTPKGIESQFQRQFQTILDSVLNSKFALPLYVKGFLPLESKSFLEETLRQYIQLTIPFFSAIMDWKEPGSLQDIIVNRFRSAGSLIKGFEAIASQKIVHQINAALTAASNGSPRRLLQLASLLITAHTERDPTDPLITAEDWQKMSQLWAFGPPEPKPLRTTEPSGESI